MRFFIYSPFVAVSGLAEIDVVHSAVNVVTSGLHLPQNGEDWGKLLGTCVLVVLYKAIDYLANRVAFRRIVRVENSAAAAPASEPAPLKADEGSS